ncbi:hypothetical protein QTO12_05920 [Vibrio owensii]|uniref:hypothetical protein n=1 Tax=Vibrio owensii TaxID=696485 RepID=UPI002F400A37
MNYTLNDLAESNDDQVKNAILEMCGLPQYITHDALKQEALEIWQEAEDERKAQSSLVQRDYY